MASNNSNDQVNSSTSSTGGKRHRDKSYRHIFKGSVLINTLLDYDDHKFSSRLTAVRFAQKLLDIGQIESVVGGDVFEDSVSLYRWCDESVLREARKLNHSSSTTTAHIPKRRIIELIDLHQADDPEESTSIDKVMTRLSDRQTEYKPYDANYNIPNRNVNNNNPEYRHHSAEEYNQRYRSRDFSDDIANVTKASHSMDDNYNLAYEDPLAAWADDVLENERFNDVDDFERQTSYESDVFSPEDIYNSSRRDNGGGDGSNLEDKSDSGISVVTYDGIEMPAIDLENINFATMVGQLQSSTAQYSNMGELLDLTTEGGSSFSDNEKQLLQQMRTMQDDHQSTVDGYEVKISELMDRISELKSLADLLETQQNQQFKNKESGLTETVPQSDITATSPASSTVTLPTTGVPPPPPPVPPPPPLNTSSIVHNHGVVNPNKRPVKPRVKMRPLFWNRVILESDNEETFWHSATEPNFDVDQFEILFGRDPSKEKKPKKSLHETIAIKKTKDNTKAPSRQQTVKLLEENRSRAVAIKLRSMHCEMSDIKNAAFKLDFSKLDVEKLYGLHEVRGSAEEMDKITHYLEDHPEACLDEPEAFLVEMSKMSQFSERIECLMFRKTLNESVFDIDQQLDIVQQACKAIHRSHPIRTVMELILAFGNYMNGGTQRGQADGFDLEVLGKLKDVKSIDNSTTLLRHIVHVNTKETESIDAGKNEASWKFPDVAIMTQASNISFHEVTKELNKLKSDIRLHSRKADIVCLNSKESLLQPFKDQMDDFFESADTMLKGQFEKLEAIQERYNDLLKFLAVKDNNGKMCTETFFGIWCQFLDDYKTQWKVEQKDIAKQMFEKVEVHRKERMRTAKRRKSIVEDGKSNLKQRFTLMRKKRSDSIANTVKLLRSQSMTGVDIATLDDSNDLVTNQTEQTTQKHDRSMSMAASTAPSDGLYKPHSRVRSRIREQNNANMPRASSTTSMQRKGESMIERMQQRRRNRVEKEEAMTTSNQSLNQSGERIRRTGSADAVNGTTAAMLAQSQMSRVGARLSQPDIPMTGATDTIKERMQRRRRERENTVLNNIANNSTNSDSSPTAQLRHQINQVKLPVANSVDLSTLRKKFTNEDTPKQPVNAARQLMNRRLNNSGAEVTKEHTSKDSSDHSHTNCDHITCMAQRMTKAAAMRGSHDKPNSNSTNSIRSHNIRTVTQEVKSTPVNQHDDKTSVFQRRRDSLENSGTSLTADTDESKIRRIGNRDNWKGSHHSLPESDSSSRRQTPSRSRLGSKDGWRGSHQSLVDGSDNSPLVTRETRSSILRREAAARANQRLSQSSSDTGSRLQRLSGWRGSQKSLHESRSPSSRNTNLRTGLHSSQPSLLDSDSKLSVSRRRNSSERETDSKSGTVTSRRSSRERRESDTSDNGITNTRTSPLRRSKDSWKGSHQSLSSDNDNTSTTKSNSTKRLGSNKSLTNLVRGNSTEDKLATRRSGSRTSSMDDSSTAVTSAPTSRRTGLRISAGVREQSSSSHATPPSTSGKSTKAGDQDALSEKDYREVLRKLSRSRTNLVTS